MARSFAGGTDQIYFGGGQISFTPTIGCHAFWIKTSQATVNACPVSHWDSSQSKDGPGFLLNNAAGKISAYCKYNGSSQAFLIASTTSINNGAWRHVALNWQTGNGLSNELWIDGVQENSANNAAAWAYSSSSGQTLTFGKSNDAFWGAFVGDLAEPAVWAGRKLVAAEIEALAKGLSPSRVAYDRLRFHAPFVRDIASRRDWPGNSGNAVPTAVGGSVSTHPRIFP